MHKAQGRVGRLVSIGQELDVQLSSFSNGPEGPNRAITHHDNISPKCSKTRCGFNILSNLLSTEQSTKVPNKDQHYRPLGPQL
jgi:hypothetical protein